MGGEDLLGILEVLFQCPQSFPSVLCGSLAELFLFLFTLLALTAVLFITAFLIVFTVANLYCATVPCSTTFPLVHLPVPLDSTRPACDRYKRKYTSALL